MQNEFYRLDNRSKKEIKNINKSLEFIENSIIEHNIRRTDAAIFRSRCKWALHGEISSKYFFALEKHNYRAKNMNSVIFDGSEISYDQGIILDKQTKFFKSLYCHDANTKF